MMSEDIMSTKDSYQNFGALLLQNNSKMVFEFSAHLGTILLPKEIQRILHMRFKIFSFSSKMITSNVELSRSELSKLHTQISIKISNINSP